ncbi:hypothetical protein B0H16DRAFT_1880471 [Mycena metata]|uniref:Nephrocystin 3-like N-terminal domain-containing protein n=1 Tax=Mycena metata TaxID=1033252 RepID=A0AAD7JZX8_9AGAR|nr:hypothetical protein B0H16DRAFT_1880471 [Mycena metata]
MLANRSNRRHTLPAQSRRVFEITAIRLDSNLLGTVTCQITSAHGYVPAQRLNARNRPEIFIRPIEIFEDEEVTVNGFHRRLWWHCKGKFSNTRRALDRQDTSVSDGSRIMIVLHYGHGFVYFTFQIVPNTMPPGIQISAISLNLTDFPRSLSRAHYMSLLAGSKTYFQRKLSIAEQGYPLRPTFTLQYNTSLQIRIQRRRFRWKVTTEEINLSYQQAARKFAQNSAAGAVRCSTICVLKVTSDYLATNITLKDSPKITAKLIRLDGNAKGAENILIDLHETEDLVQRKQRLVGILGESKGLFESVMRYIGAASELHPIAKAVFTAVNQLYLDLKEREGCDLMVLDLLDDIAASYRHITNVENFRDRTELNKSIYDLERLAQETLNTVLNYYDVEAEFRKVLSVLQHGVRRPKPMNGCAPRTRRDIFSDIQRWIDFNGPGKRNILWIHGHPGSGKTSIASTLAEKLRKSKRETRLGSSFFFERDNVDFTAPSVFWSQVAYDLAQLSPEFAAGVVDVLERRDLDFNTTPIDEQFKVLIVDQLTSLAALPSSLHFVVVVDAVDECGGDRLDSSERRALLATFQAWAKMGWPHFRLIITSRREQPMLKVLGPISAAVELSLVTKAVSEDIRRFLKHEMRRVVQAYDADGADESLRGWPRPSLLHSLTTMAGGLFVWAKTLINFLESEHPGEQLELVLGGGDMGPKGDINMLYGKILRISFYQHGPPTATVLKNFQGVVGSVLIAKRPLTSTSDINCEMELAGVKPSAWKDIRRRLASVMEPGTNFLRFNHITFPEFLTRDSSGCPEEFWIQTDVHKKRRTLAALARMQDGLQFNICRLTTSYWFNSTIPLQDLEGQRNRHASSTLLYCCRYWMDHWDSNHGNPEILDELHRFLTTKFLYWVEILSLFRHLADEDRPLLDYAVWRLHLVAEWARTKTPVAKCFQDGIAFLTEFRNPIEASTPHVYLSALPFTHPTSEVSKAFKPIFPNAPWVKMRESAIPGLHDAPTLDANEVAAVVFLPGKIIAGRPLNGHGGKINSMAFSNGGLTLASGSDDTTVRVWDLGLGGYIVFSGHTDAVTSVSFPPSGKYVMSGSNDGDLRFWDPVSKKEMKAPAKTDQGPISSAAFLDEDNFVTDGKDGSHLPLKWTRRSSPKRPLQAIPGDVPVTSIAGFGKRIITGMSDGTMHVTDDSVETWHAHEDTVTSVKVHGSKNRFRVPRRDYSDLVSRLASSLTRTVRGPSRIRQLGRFFPRRQHVGFRLQRWDKEGLQWNGC